MTAFTERLISGATLITAFIFLFLYFSPTTSFITVLAILLYILLFEWPKIINPQKALFWIITPFYPILPALLIAYMCSNLQYRILIFFMTFLIFAHDTGGYIIGSLIGRHKLAPKISPKKTWEGFFGGYLSTMIMLLLLLHFNQSKISILFTITFSFAISALATIGDLFESYLKRRANIKDSGSILPGHGGLLDRFDGFLIVIFLFFFMRNFLLKIYNL